MRICNNCGAELSDDANFCSRCGRSVDSQRQVSGWLLLTGAVVGAIAALFIGYVLSFVAFKLLLNFAGHGMLDPQGLAVFDRLTPRFAGLLYTSAHHINLNGFSRGGVFLSVMLPVWIWTIFPLIAITAGGWVSGVISRPSGRRDILAASIVSTAVYVLLLIYMRPYFAVGGDVLNLIQIDGTRPAFPGVLLAPSVRSIFLDGGLLSLALFVVGTYAAVSGFGWTSAKHALTGKGVLPAWASGGILAYLFGIGAVLFLLIIACLVLVFKGSVSAASAAFLAGPAAAGIVYYFLHGVTITALNTAGVGGAFAHLYSASLSSGLRELMKFPNEPWKVLSLKPLSPVMWAGVLIPAVAIVLAAYLTYRNRDRDEKLVTFSLKMSLIYTFLMLIGISFFTLRMNAADVTPGFTGLSRISLAIVPEIWPSVILGLVFGFIFSLIGSFLAARRQGRAV